MKTESVTATKKIEGVEYQASVDFQVPETADEMKEQWGDSVTVSNASANAKIGLQSAIRRRIEKQVKENGSVDMAAISTELSGYKPGEAAPKKDPVDALLGKFQGLPEEKQAEILKALKAKAKQR